MSRRTRTRNLAAALAPWVLLGLLATGCSRQDAAGRDATTSVNEEASEYYDVESRELGDTEVEVRLFERTIEMPASLPEGRVTFVVTNDGEAEHGFEIEGRGMKAELEAPLAPGETGSLEVELAAGTYTVYCPVEDHRGQGMDLRLRVVR
jgi:uncharacterized cupredoxin-like copper-binding protein